MKEAQLVYQKTPAGKKSSREKTIRWRAKRFRADPVAARRKERDVNLYRLYRLRLEDFEAMEKKQGGRCAVCDCGPVGGRGRKLHVDHDHETGIIRGLLCHGCNAAIGLFREDPDLMTKAIVYLKRHSHNKKRKRG